MGTEPPIVDYLSAKGPLGGREAVLCTVAWLHDAGGRRVVWPSDVTVHYPRRHMPALPKVRAPADVMRALAETGLLERVEGLTPDELAARRPALGGGAAPPVLGLPLRIRVGPAGGVAYRLTTLGRRVVAALPDRDRHAAVMKSVVSRVWVPRPDDWTPWSAAASSSPRTER